MTQAIQSNGIAPALASQPCEIAKQPWEHLLIILAQIYEFRDVAHVNGACKGLKVINESSSLVRRRLQLLNIPLDNSKTYTFEKYVQIVRNIRCKVQYKAFCRSFPAIRPYPKYSVRIPHDTRVANLLRNFQKMSRENQIAGFVVVLNALNSTDEIVQKFYRALPKDVQSEFHHQIFLAYESNTIISEGMDYSGFLAKHVIANNIRSARAIKAATQLQIQMQSTQSR